MTNWNIEGDPEFDVFSWLTAGLLIIVVAVGMFFALNGCAHTPAMTQALVDHEVAARIAWERCKLSDGCDEDTEDDWRAFVEQAVALRVAANPRVCLKLTPEVRDEDPLLWDACEGHRIETRGL